MANIGQQGGTTIRIDKWLGLNEAAEGDTRIKAGEASVCDNWMVTGDHTLRKRPGAHDCGDLGVLTATDISGLWSGTVRGNEILLAVAKTDGKLIRVTDSGGTLSGTVLGSIDTSGRVGFFPWGGDVYILDGNDYYRYDGTTLSSVAGYRPIVSITVPPAGGGTTLESVNLLNGCRRSWFSPDGSATVFRLPEQALTSLDWVKDRVTGTVMAAGTDYTADLANGTVTFTTAPATGVDSIEIAWTVTSTLRAQITKNRFAELYNGTADNRVFLYGDNSHKLRYSGVTHETGEPSAEYFPDLNEIAVGEANTPVTGLLRHYSRMVVFKTNSTWVVSYGTVTLADGSVTAAFYLSPVNRAIGNEAPGQVQLVLNSPRTLFGGAVYEWRNNSSYTANLTIDERQAKRISDRVNRTLSGFPLRDCVCWDDNAAQCWYICYGKRALVHNYAADAWYTLQWAAVNALARFNGSLYLGTDNGLLLVAERFTDDIYDDGETKGVPAYYESGSMAFNTENTRKYLAEIWLSSRPLTDGGFRVTARTDADVKHTQTVTPKAGGESLDFGALDFGALGFGTTTIARIVRTRLRARRFAYMKLIFEADSGNASVLSALFHISYGGKEL